MDRRLAQLFKTRWETVEKLERIELQQTTPLQKLYELAQILRTGQKLMLFSREGSRNTDLQEVRKRWIRLKRGPVGNERR